MDSNFSRPSGVSSLPGRPLHGLLALSASALTPRDTGHRSNLPRTCLPDQAKVKSPLLSLECCPLQTGTKRDESEPPN